MKTNWKKLFIWSSLGGLVVGTAASLAGKSGMPGGRSLDFKKIPQDCERVFLWTGRLEIVQEGKTYTVHDEYDLQATPFRLWSVLDGPARGEKRQEGASIYHVTLLRYFDAGEEDENYSQEPQCERFYGTVAVLGRSGKPYRINYISRGGLLEIRECRVGGTSNGVETGKVHRSAAPILNYRFECRPAA